MFVCTKRSPPKRRQNYCVCALISPPELHKTHATTPPNMSRRRVGTGLNAEQYEYVRERLRPLLIELGPGQRPPRCYRVTGRWPARQDRRHTPRRRVVAA